jgi:iron complex outermembrane recepter protein
MTLRLLASLAIACASGFPGAHAEEDPPATELEAVRVEASPERGYAPASARTATKTDTPLYATPMTIHVVPRGVIEDQAAQTLERILDYVPGVQANDVNSGFGAKTFYLRGFDIQDSIFVDGIRGLSFNRVDPAVVESVDVLKGSPAGLYGRIEPGGMINVVTKRPTPDRSVGVDQSIGSYAFTRTEIDATGRLDSDGKFLGRGIVAYQYDNAPRDTTLERHVTLAQMLSWLPDASNTVDLRVEYRDFKDSTDGGIPFIPVSVDATGKTIANRIGDIPRNVYFGPADNVVHAMTTELSTSWTHTLDDRWKIKPLLQWSRVYQPGTEGGFTGWLNQPADGWGAQTPTVASIYAGNPSNFYQRRLHEEIDLTGELSYGSIRHRVLASVEYNDWKYLYAFWTAAVGPNPIDWTNPVYPSERSFVVDTSADPPTVSNDRRDLWWSWTMQDEVRIGDRWRLLLGIRFDRATTTSVGQYNGFQYGLDHVGDRKYQPRVGLGYDVVDWLAAYASYAESYGANDYAILYDGSPSRSQTSSQREIGLKAHGRDDTLTASVAAFELAKRNLTVDVPLARLGAACTVPDPGLPQDCQVQVGREGSRGVELEVNGALSKAWSVRAGYSHVSAKVLDGGDTATPGATSFPVGNRLPAVPVNSGFLWAQYADPTGWALGVGVVAQGRRPFDLDNTGYFPAFVRLDAVASYTWKANRTRWVARVKGDNLGHASDYQSSYAGYLPPRPRTVFASLGVWFE